VAVLNTDSLGGKAASQAGSLTNVTQYDGLGLQQSAQFTETPGDDHGVFFRHGFRASVMNLGSLPYADPNYHLATDTPDRVDMANVVASSCAPSSPPLPRGERKKHGPLVRASTLMSTMLGR